MITCSIPYATVSDPCTNRTQVHSSTSITWISFQTFGTQQQAQSYSGALFHPPGSKHGLDWDNRHRKSKGT